MLSLLVTILVVCIVFSLIFWILSQLTLPAPFAQIARVVCVVLFCIWLLYILVPLAGGGFGHTMVR
jgi:hypothetical protein